MATKPITRDRWSHEDVALLVCARLQGNCEQPQALGSLDLQQIERLSERCKKSVPQTFEKIREIERFLGLQPTPEPPRLDEIDTKMLVAALRGKLPNSPAARKALTSLQRIVR